MDWTKRNFIMAYTLPEPQLLRHFYLGWIHGICIPGRVNTCKTYNVIIYTLYVIILFNKNSHKNIFDKKIFLFVLFNIKFIVMVTVWGLRRKIFCNRIQFFCCCMLSTLWILILSTVTPLSTHRQWILVATLLTSPNSVYYL